MNKSTYPQDENGWLRSIPANKTDKSVKVRKFKTFVAATRFLGRNQDLCETAIVKQRHGYWEIVREEGKTLFQLNLEGRL